MKRNVLIDEYNMQLDVLNKLESELIDLISKTEDERLMLKFSDWQEQRLRCKKSKINMKFYKLYELTNEQIERKSS